MQNINRVILTGNLTRDPELRTAGSTPVCSLRVACNGRTKNRDTGQWEDQPNYFDVTVFGAQGENAHRYLAKGRGVAVDGRLRWREWTTDSGDRRQAVDIIADNVQFLSDGSGGARQDAAPPTSSGDFAPVSGFNAPADDDIPF